MFKQNQDRVTSHSTNDQQAQSRDNQIKRTLQGVAPETQQALEKLVAAHYVQHAERLMANFCLCFSLGSMKDAKFTELQEALFKDSYLELQREAAQYLRRGKVLHETLKPLLEAELPQSDVISALVQNDLSLFAQDGGLLLGRLQTLHGQLNEAVALRRAARVP
ncbi:MAG: hypothetical protein KDD62_14460, partial [Bdellovibrionales bacterium]|nr:hypothetical protein [Bdellovibrionales bacterium]